MKAPGFVTPMDHHRVQGRLNSRDHVAIEWTVGGQRLRAEGYTADVSPKGCLPLDAQRFVTSPRVPHPSLSLPFTTILIDIRARPPCLSYAKPFRYFLHMRPHLLAIFSLNRLPPFVPPVLCPPPTPPLQNPRTRFPVHPRRQFP